MMNLYGAEDHLLVISDTIDAEEHRHSFLQVTVALGDECQMDVEGQSLSFSGIILNSNVVHRLNGGGQPLLLLLIDSASNMAESFKRFISGRDYFVLSPDVMNDVREFVIKEYPSAKDAESYTAFLKVLLELLGVEHRSPAFVDPRIRELIGLVKGCTDSDHSVSLYAAQIGLSNSRLSHLFKENTGISLSGYLLLHKLQKATYLIFNGASITDAAMAAGFDSPSHFASSSKRLLGMAAKDIRKDSVFLQVSCLH